MRLNGKCTASSRLVSFCVCFPLHYRRIAHHLPPHLHISTDKPFCLIQIMHACSSTHCSRACSGSPLVNDREVVFHFALFATQSVSQVNTTCAHARLHLELIGAGLEQIAIRRKAFEKIRKEKCLLKTLHMAKSTAVAQLHTCEKTSNRIPHNAHCLQMQLLLSSFRNNAESGMEVSVGRVCAGAGAFHFHLNRSKVLRSCIVRESFFLDCCCRRRRWFSWMRFRFALARARRGAMQMIFELFGIDSTVSQSIHFSFGAGTICCVASRIDTTVAKAQNTHLLVNPAGEAVGQWLSCRDLNQKIETSEKWFKSSRDYLLLHSSEPTPLDFHCLDLNVALRNTITNAHMPLTQWDRESERNRGNGEIFDGERSRQKRKSIKYRRTEVVASIYLEKV